MTRIFKYLVLSCAVSVVFGFTSVRDDANWFKNSQNIKNRFVTGVVNGIVDFDCHDTMNGENMEGECLSKVECTKSGGKVGNLCSLLGSCCVFEKTCSQASSSKLFYFVPPGKFQTECSLTVNIYSKDVCQIRLDFERFDIAEPTSQIINTAGTTAYSSYQCLSDSFEVENVKNLGFPHLCGKNKGQHIYIPVGDDQERIKLSFRFTERHGSNANLAQPDWRIKIRQLECRKSGHEHLLNAPSKLMAMYNNLKKQKKPKSDWEMIAPPGCLQYYPTKTGTFESFNYDEGRGKYIGNLHYVICFRKTPDVCGAKYSTSGKFQMNYNPDKNDTQKIDRCRGDTRKPASPTVSQDYIQIPVGVFASTNLQDYYCNEDLVDQTIVYSNSLGLLYVGVHTDNFFPNKKSKTKDEEANNIEEIGFKLKYELLSGNCDISSGFFR